MTEPDIIRIDGVEYEECRECPGDKCADPTYVCIRPKRKQTGWICAVCQLSPLLGPCLKMGASMVGPCDRPTRCLASGIGDGFDWRPFYGKVVE